MISCPHWPRPHTLDLDSLFLSTMCFHPCKQVLKGLWNHLSVTKSLTSLFLVQTRVCNGESSVGADSVWFHNGEDFSKELFCFVLLHILTASTKAHTKFPRGIRKPSQDILRIIKDESKMMMWSGIHDVDILENFKQQWSLCCSCSLLTRYTLSGILSKQKMQNRIKNKKDIGWKLA